MRVAVVIAIGLLVAGCEHMYGGMDRSRMSDGAPRGPDATELLLIARAEVERQGILLEDVRPPSIIDDGARWVVVLDPPPKGWKGGGVEVEIDKTSKRVLGLERAK